MAIDFMAVTVEAHVRSNEQNREAPKEEEKKDGKDGVQRKQDV